MDPRRAFFERLAGEWDARQPPGREADLRRLLAPFREDLQASGNILEVGTGTGALIPLLRELSPAAPLVSIDLVHGMLRRAHQRYPNAWLVQADAHSLPFPSGFFDRVVCHNVLPHFRDRRAALAELARALHPGGLLLILHDAGREQVNAIHQSVGGAIGNDRLPTGAELHRLLTESGFSDLEIEDSPNGYWAIGWRAEAGRSRF